MGLRIGVRSAEAAAWCRAAAQAVFEGESSLVPMLVAATMRARASVLLTAAPRPVSYMPLAQVIALAAPRAPRRARCGRGPIISYVLDARRGASTPSLTIPMRRRGVKLTPTAGRPVARVPSMMPPPRHARGGHRDLADCCRQTAARADARLSIQTSGARHVQDDARPPRRRRGHSRSRAPPPLRRRAC